MIKRFWSVFIFLFVTILAFTHNNRELQLERENGKVLAQMRGGGRSKMGVSSPSQRFGLGVRIGYDFDVEIRSLGSQFRIPIGPIQIIPSGDIFLVEGNMDWQINLDAAFSLGLGLRRIIQIRGIEFYGGGGLAFTRRDIAHSSEDENRIGTNLFAGIDVPLLRFPIQPFVEARWTFIDDETLFHLVGGFNVLFGGERRRGLGNGQRSRDRGNSLF